MERSGLFYMRFMNNILVLAPTRPNLRRDVKAVNEVLASLRLDNHPDKRLIGRIEKGFGFVGYHFGSQVLEVAEATIKRFVEHATQLYEQGHRKPKKAPLLERYVRRWLGWADGGLKPRHAYFGVPVCLAGHSTMSHSPPLVSLRR
jgi:RNA-directed DNA polymerase